MLDRVMTDRAKTDLLPCAVTGLTYKAGGQLLLNGIDAEIGSAPITVLMGPNGAGKSLLLRLLHGLLKPSAGEVTWGGTPLSQDIRRRQAMVFQKPVLLRRSVAANIDFVLKLRGNRGALLPDAVLDGAGLRALASRPARLLSGGEQQRLQLAQALALEPEVLFLDEPTASLDPASTALIEQTVARVARDGVKVLFVTHDVAQARRLADEVIFMNKGRIAEQSSSATFFERPRSEAARNFLAGKLVI